MHVVRYDAGDVVRVGVLTDGEIRPVAGVESMAALLALPLDEARRLVEAAGGPATPVGEVRLLPPVDGLTEVWAAGVTYKRSEEARMEESGTPDVYSKVYAAERPEIFFKASARRVVGPEGRVSVRADSTWDVPEPELAVVVNAHAEIVGYTIGNDVSSRSIEGENPLYLPQAKVYAACATLGPVVALAWELPDVTDLAIRLVIRRGGAIGFQAETSTSQIHRPLPDLVTYLFRHNEFPAGVVLMTGTGIIPPPEFTLEDGDEVEIAIDGIGALRNPVIRLAE